MLSDGEKLTIPLSGGEKFTIASIVAATLIVAAMGFASALAV
jgi:hypothetical protein